MATSGAARRHHRERVRAARGLTHHLSARRPHGGADRRPRTLVIVHDRHPPPRSPLRSDSRHALDSGKPDARRIPHQISMLKHDRNPARARHNSIQELRATFEGTKPREREQPRRRGPDSNRVERAPPPMKRPQVVRRSGRRSYVTNHLSKHPRKKRSAPGLPGRSEHQGGSGGPFEAPHPTKYRSRARTPTDAGAAAPRRPRSSACTRSTSR